MAYVYCVDHDAARVIRVESLVAVAKALEPWRVVLRLLRKMTVVHRPTQMRTTIDWSNYKHQTKELDLECDLDRETSDGAVKFAPYLGGSKSDRS